MILEIEEIDEPIMFSTIQSERLDIIEWILNYRSPDIYIKEHPGHTKEIHLIQYIVEHTFDWSAVLNVIFTYFDINNDIKYLHYDDYYYINEYIECSIVFIAVLTKNIDLFDFLLMFDEIDLTKRIKILKSLPEMNLCECINFFLKYNLEREAFLNLYKNFYIKKLTKIIEKNNLNINSDLKKFIINFC